MKNLAERVRDRVWHSLCSDTADVAGITLAELQQVPMGGRQLSPEQVAALARYFGIWRDNATSYD
jgi:hypothetical protein